MARIGGKRGKMGGPGAARSEENGRGEPEKRWDGRGQPGKRLRTDVGCRLKLRLQTEVVD